MQLRRQSRIAAAFGIAALGVTVGAFGSASAEDSSTGPLVGQAVSAGLSVPARDLPPATSSSAPSQSRVNPLAGSSATPSTAAAVPDPLAASSQTDDRPDPGGRPQVPRDAEPVRLRRLQPARHDRRREQEPVRPGGQRDQGRGLRQERHPAAAGVRPRRPVGHRDVQQQRRRPAGQLRQPRQPLGAGPVPGPAPALLRGLAGGQPARRLPPVRVQRPELPRLLQGRRVEERLLRLGEREHLHRVRVRPRQDARRRFERLVHQVRRRDELPDARRRRREARRPRGRALLHVQGPRLPRWRPRPDRALPADSGLRRRRRTAPSS